MGNIFSDFEKDCKEGDVDKCLNYVKENNIKCGYVYDGYFNKYKGTVLTLVCKYKLPSIALSLIEDIKYTDNNNLINDETESLIRNRKNKKEVSHCSQSFESNKQYKLDYVDSDGHTALIYACMKLPEKEKMSIEKRQLMNDFAIKLIKSGNSNPGYCGKWGSTPLMFMCQSNLTDVALELIYTGESNPNEINDIGMSAIAYACDENMIKVVQELMKMIDFKDSEENKNITNISVTLTSACKYNMTNLIFKILTEIKNLDLNKCYYEEHTALMWACINNESKVIYELIKREDIDYGIIDKNKSTALIYALQNNVNEDIIMIFINSGKCCPEKHDKYDFDALFYASKYNFKNAANALALIKTKGYSYYFANLNSMTAVTKILDIK
jgi:ankyrin repeat protein